MVNASINALRERHPWGAYYADHPPRKETALYARSRKLLRNIARRASRKGRPKWYYGNSPWEDHHGGGLWVHDDDGWFFIRNFAGIEWAAQFCAQPKKVDVLRRNALRVYQGLFYWATKAAILKIDPSYPFDAILKEEIVDADKVARWTDSIFNASVPLPKLVHTGIAPKGHGIHHYPTPVCDIAFFKYGDFNLWVKDPVQATGKNGKRGRKAKPKFNVAAVVPVHRRGADPHVRDYGKTAVIYATPNTALCDKFQSACRKRKVLLADSNHFFTKQAFARQQTEGTRHKRRKQ